MRRLYYTIIILIILGLGLLSYNGEVTINFYGIFLAIASSILYAFYVVASKRKAKSTHPLLLTITVCYGSSFVFLILSLLHGSFELPQMNLCGHRYALL